MNENPFVSVFDALPEYLKQPRPLRCGCLPAVVASVAVKVAPQSGWALYCVCEVCGIMEARDVKQG